MEQKTTVELKTLICDQCKTTLCPKCSKPKNYLKWTLCEVCFDKYNIKHLERKNILTIKRQIRKEKEKYRSEFVISFTNGLLFKNLLECLFNLNVESVFLRIKSDSLKISGMDVSRIITIRVKFNLKNLVEYKYNQNQKVILDVSEVLKLLPSHNTNLILHRKRGSLDLRIQHGKHCFTQQNDESPPEVVPFRNLLNIPYTNHFLIYAEKLCSILENARKTSEIICLKIEPNRIVFYTERNEGHSYEYEYNIPTHLKIPEAFEKQGYYIIAFSVSYLHDLVKWLVLWIKTDLKISVKYDNPLRIDFELDGGHEINFFQAPRVEDDPAKFIDKEEDDDDND